MENQFIFIKFVVYLMRLSLVIQKIVNIYFFNFIYKPQFNFLISDLAFKNIKHHFIDPFKLLSFGSYINSEKNNSLDGLYNNEIWYFISGKNDNIRNQYLIRDRIQSIFDRPCNIISNNHVSQTSELIENFLQSLSPIKTRFIYNCIEIIKKAIINDNVKKVILIFKKDESLLLNILLNHLIQQSEINSIHLSKIEYFFFDDIAVTCSCY